MSALVASKIRNPSSPNIETCAKSLMLVDVRAVTVHLGQAHTWATNYAEGHYLSVRRICDDDLLNRSDADGASGG